jgi:CRP-like cAMP-binding protein
VHPQPEQVAAIPLFSGLRADQVARLCYWFELRNVGSGAEIVSEGAVGYFFFIIEEGTAVVSQGGVAIGTLGAGDFFGEMAILGDGRRTASVTTTSPSVLLLMVGTEFRALEQALPEAAAQIRKAMSERLARSN